MFKRFAYNFLLKNFLWLNKLSLFHWLWNRVTQPRFDVKTKLFGAPFYLPSTYRYPVTARLHPDFNNPLLQLVYESYRNKNRKLIIADVGAAVGDTFLFLRQNLTQAVGKVYCIEGFPFFLSYLAINTRKYSESVIVPVILSDRKERINDLVQIHESTASSQGKNFIDAETLDSITAIKEPLDILKIDVDGFDGKVLEGARILLQTQQPFVIFEFHPILLRSTGNDLLQPFKVLKQCNYSDLVWFDKTGKFCDFSLTDDFDFIKCRIELCLKDPENDWHFDIVVLPENSLLDKQELAACRFAKNKTYSF